MAAIAEGGGRCGGRRRRRLATLRTGPGRRVIEHQDLVARHSAAANGGFKVWSSGASLWHESYRSNLLRGSLEERSTADRWSQAKPGSCQRKTASELVNSPSRPSVQVACVQSAQRLRFVR